MSHRWSGSWKTFGVKKMIDIMIYVAIVVIVCLVVWFILSKINLPGPSGTIIEIAVVVIVACIVIGALLAFGGHGHMLWLPRHP